jgi:hypothetical protein
MVGRKKSSRMTTLQKITFDNHELRGLKSLMGLMWNIAHKAKRWHDEVNLQLICDAYERISSKLDVKKDSQSLKLYRAELMACCIVANRVSINDAYMQWALGKAVERIRKSLIDTEQIIDEEETEIQNQKLLS